MRTRMPYTRVAGLALACFLVGANAMAAGAQATTDTTLVKEFPPEALKAVGGEKLDVGAGKAEKFAIPPVPDDPLTYVRGSDNVRGSDQDLQEGLKFNFRGVPLDTVLDYLSRAAGFVIVRDTQVSGNVDVVSHQPLNKDEAFMLLNTLLNQKGLAAIRNERTLTIVKRDEARTRDLPVRVGAEPEAIPKTDEMVTQI
ncbi:hypothetical protein FJY63_10550, partial [Candidatus Sumerlaeota bacterium]|nr:hypothetical protein [Candidatus Sumerlaeota bacterium]